MKIIFATSNPHKLEEARQIVGSKFEILSAAQCGVTEEIPEEGSTLEENALFKAHYLYRVTGQNCFADDTGLEVDTLGGRPGIYSARFAGPSCDPVANMNKLIKELYTAPSREARFRTVIALYLNGAKYTFEGVLEGAIILEPIGDNGFGYDPIFLPKGYNKTLAQLSAEEKNLISHRGIAMRKLALFLNSNI